jgi:hypothetical protein
MNGAIANHVPAAGVEIIFPPSTRLSPILLVNVVVSCAWVPAWNVVRRDMRRCQRFFRGCLVPVISLHGRVKSATSVCRSGRSAAYDCPNSCSLAAGFWGAVAFAGVGFWAEIAGAAKNLVGILHFIPP